MLDLDAHRAAARGGQEWTMRVEPRTARLFQRLHLDTVLTFTSGERESDAFTVPGTYDYYCSVHPHMTGKVIVQQP